MLKTYSLVYYPELETDKSYINFICSDNRIHFRFKDYVKSEIIQGFEKKLTYLLSYLFNFSFKNEINIESKTNNELIKEFLQIEDIKNIISNISIYKNASTLKGFKGRVNYNKNEASKYPFGKIDEEYFPKVKEQSHNLKCFLDSLHIDLLTYLFDDRYVIILGNINKKDINVKFINKELKSQRQCESDFVKLW